MHVYTIWLIRHSRVLCLKICKTFDITIAQYAVKLIFEFLRRAVDKFNINKKETVALLFFDRSVFFMTFRLRCQSLSFALAFALLPTYQSIFCRKFVKLPTWQHRVSRCSLRTCFTVNYIRDDVFMWYSVSGLRLNGMFRVKQLFSL